MEIERWLLSARGHVSGVHRTSPSLAQDKPHGKSHPRGLTSEWVLGFRESLRLSSLGRGSGSHHFHVIDAVE